MHVQRLLLRLYVGRPRRLVIHRASSFSIFPVIAASLLSANCSGTASLGTVSPPSISDDAFQVRISSRTPPQGLLGKTVDYNFESKGTRTVGTETSEVAAVTELSQIKISKSGEIYLFARPGAERGTVYKLNTEIDVTKNPAFADPMVLSNTNVSVWRATSTFSNSSLVISSFMEGVLKGTDVTIRDRVLIEIGFSDDFRTCAVKRVLLKVAGRDLVHEQSLSRPLSCAVRPS